MDEEQQSLLRISTQSASTQSTKGSSLGQTVLNQVNVLAGAGLLSLPFAVKLSGWIPGLAILSFSSTLAGYTAKLLARCMDVDSRIRTYAEVAHASYGTMGHRVVSTIFVFNVVAACVALTILFGDTMALLVPSIGVSGWKALCGAILLPLQFLPLRFLSLLSAVGIVSCLGLVGLTVMCGVVRTEAPGSLWHPAETSLWPQSWQGLLLSLGLFMVPWGVHASFPAMYRDMTEPHKFKYGLTVSFSTVYLVDIAVACSGYLMFGPEVAVEITTNLLNESRYPHGLLTLVVISTAAIALTKIPITARALVVAIENELELEQDAHKGSPEGKRALYLHLARSGIRLALITAVVLISILLPDFNTVMALTGSAICYVMCLILPMVFHQRLYKGSMSRKRCWLERLLILLCSLLATAGSVAALIY